MKKIIVVIMLILLVGCQSEKVISEIPKSEDVNIIEDKQISIESMDNNEKNTEVDSEEIEEFAYEESRLKVFVSEKSTLKNFGDVTVRVMGYIDDMEDGRYKMILEVLKDDTVVYRLDYKEADWYWYVYSIDGLFIEDVNGDGLNDITIIPKYIVDTTHNALQAIRYGEVLLQDGNSFIHDESASPDVNWPEYEASFTNILEYYGHSDLEMPTYSIEQNEFIYSDEYNEILATYPIVKSDNQAFDNRVNTLIYNDIYKYALEYAYGDSENHVSTQIDFKVVREDRFLSIKYNLLCIPSTAAHPMSKLKTFNLDMENYYKLDSQDILLNFSEVNKLLVNFGYLVKPASNNSDYDIEGYVKDSINDYGFSNNIYFSNDELFASVEVAHSAGDYATIGISLDDVIEFIIYDGIANDKSSVVIDKYELQNTPSIEIHTIEDLQNIYIDN